MKILYGIQGTGNGHFSRAQEIIPELQKWGDLDIAVSGQSGKFQIPLNHPVKYNFRGISYMVGKRGGIDILKTLNYVRKPTFIRDIRTVPVDRYDVVINDFEPITAWAAKLKKVPCIAVSHQAATFAKEAPKPKLMNPLSLLAARKIAPFSDYYGFHFESYNEHIYRPLIRECIRQLSPSDRNYYTVYLAPYAPSVIKDYLSKYSDTRFEVFTSFVTEPYHDGHISFMPLANQRFLSSLENCKGVICGAGFELSAEALFLGKKLLVIPLRGQIEQRCNVAALDRLGVYHLKNLGKRGKPTFEAFLNDPKTVDVHYPNEIEEIVQKILSKSSQLAKAI